MLQKIQTWLKSREEAIKKEQELRKAQSYYRLVKAGNAFISFVQQDMKKNGDQVNRHMRRRMEKELNEKGILSPELVEYYAQKIDYVLAQIHQRLNPPKVQPQNKNGVQVRNTPPPGAKVVELGKQEPKSAA
jgi:predicted transcriptional regulator